MAAALALTGLVLLFFFLLQSRTQMNVAGDLQFVRVVGVGKKKKKPTSDLWFTITTNHVVALKETFQAINSEFCRRRPNEIINRHTSHMSDINSPTDEPVG